MPNSRNDILALLNRRQIGRVPCFSGLISITQPGLAAAGLHFHETHRDAARMAKAAASTYRLSGFESAVVPFDMCVEAETLGAEVDFREDAGRPEIPRVRQILIQSISEIPFPLSPYSEAKGEKEKGVGRLPIICDAIRLLKEDVGQEIAIGAYVPGPFTLLFFLMEAGGLFESFKRTPDVLHEVLSKMADVIAGSAGAYHAAGADFITVHEMGGSPGVVGPARFEAFVLPALKSLIARIPGPRVLSICGNTNGSMPLIAQAEADAYSVDQTNDLAASRAALPGALLFGNIDPVGVLADGSEADVRLAVDVAVSAGVDAVWPGCDLWPLVPAANLKALVAQSQNKRPA